MIIEPTQCIQNWTLASPQNPTTKITPHNGNSLVPVLTSKTLTSSSTPLFCTPPLLLQEILLALTLKYILQIKSLPIISTATTLVQASSQVSCPLHLFSLYRIILLKHVISYHSPAMVPISLKVKTKSFKWSPEHIWPEVLLLLWPQLLPLSPTSTHLHCSSQTGLLVVSSMCSYLRTFALAVSTALECFPPRYSCLFHYLHVSA